MMKLSLKTIKTNFFFPLFSACLDALNKAMPNKQQQMKKKNTKNKNETKRERKSFKLKATFISTVQ